MMFSWKWLVWWAKQEGSPDRFNSFFGGLWSRQLAEACLWIGVAVELS